MSNHDASILNLAILAMRPLDRGILEPPEDLLPSCLGSCRIGGFIALFTEQTMWEGRSVLPTCWGSKDSSGRYAPRTQKLRQTLTMSEETTPTNLDLASANEMELTLF